MIENTQYAGSEWVQRSMKVENMSPLGEEVADLLGDLFRGIYHLPSKQLRHVDWRNPRMITFNLGGNISTYDNDTLTRLVVLSHDRMIRVLIDACNFYYIKLLFSKRDHRDGEETYSRMPTMENHVETIRKEYSVKAVK